MDRIIGNIRDSQSNLLVAGGGVAALSVLALWRIQRSTSTNTRLNAPALDKPCSSFPDGNYQFYYEQDDCVDVVVAQEGPAAESPITVIQRFNDAVSMACDSPALRVKRGGEWVTWTWGEYQRDVLTAARALMHLGLEQFGSVGIIGFNSPEWFIADLAAIFCGAKGVGIYTTNKPPACSYVMQHCGANIVFTEDETQTAKFIEEQENMPQLTTVVQWMGDVPKGSFKGLSVLSWREFMALGNKTSQDALSARMALVKPGHCVSLIYTSGTTGNPKAVMISHDSLTWTPATTMTHVAETGWGRGKERVVSYLPLSHIAAQLLDIHAPMYMCAEMGGQCTVYFAQPDALRGSLGDTLKEVRPTGFLGVPRVWEKIHEKLKQVASTVTGFKKKLSTWAKACGLRHLLAIRPAIEGEVPPLRESFLEGVAYFIAKTLILKKIHQALGLDQAKLFASAAAPLSETTWSYFGSIGVPIMDIYGMSECTGPQTLNQLSAFGPGYAGPPLPGCAVKLDFVEGRDKPGEGEVCFRGRHIMMGYLHDPDKTAECIDEEGWLHSGDIGSLDRLTTGAPMLRITGRAKEILITAGGENVAPVPIEDVLKSLMPALSQVIVIGDKRKFLSCLVTLHMKPSASGEDFLDELAGESATVDPTAHTVAEAATSPVWKEYIMNGLRQFNEKYSVSRAQNVQSFAILPMDFTVNGGELTPTQKIKRSVVYKKYEGIIENQLYGSESMKRNAYSGFNLQSISN